MPNGFTLPSGGILEIASGYSRTNFVMSNGVVVETTAGDMRPAARCAARNGFLPVNTTKNCRGAPALPDKGPCVKVNGKLPTSFTCGNFAI
jgi:hypothetical protein